VSWPAHEHGLPSTTPSAGVLTYDEGLGVGHRRPEGAARYLYPFGHGLGYTTWSHDRVDVKAAGADGYVVDVTVRNTGDRPGREVVQVYASRDDGAVDRPARWLAGFACIDAAPGTSTDVAIHIPVRAFRHWDVASSAWAVEPGTFRLEVGSAAGRVAHEAVVDAPDP
jgi:beta-glucosidase